MYDQSAFKRWMRVGLWLPVTWEESVGIRRISIWCAYCISCISCSFRKGSYAPFDLWRFQSSRLLFSGNPANLASTYDIHRLLQTDVRFSWCSTAGTGELVAFRYLLLLNHLCNKFCFMLRKIRSWIFPWILPWTLQKALQSWFCFSQLYCLVLLPLMVLVNWIHSSTPWLCSFTIIFFDVLHVLNTELTPWLCSSKLSSLMM